VRFVDAVKYQVGQGDGIDGVVLLAAVEGLPAEGLQLQGKRI
jgi:hypothetical protein